MYKLSKCRASSGTVAVLQVEFDTYDAEGANTWRLQYMQKRTKIVEIVAANGLIFALAQSGACAAFSRGDLAAQCFVPLCFVDLVV